MDNLQPALQFGPSPELALRDALEGRGPWELPFEARRALLILQDHPGAAHPVPLHELAARLDMTDRQVKALIRSFVVDFEIPVGASRAEPCGYYLAMTAEERLAAARPYIFEIRKLAARVKALVGTPAFVEQLGQMRLEETEANAK